MMRMAPNLMRNTSSVARSPWRMSTSRCVTLRELHALGEIAKFRFNRNGDGGSSSTLRNHQSETVGGGEA